MHDTEKPVALSTEEKRFRSAVPASMEAVRCVASHYQKSGWEVEVVEAKMRPDFKRRSGYGDDEDLRARLTIFDPWLRIEVKGRTFDFVDEATFPFPTIILDRANKADEKRADVYFNVDRSCRYAATISRELTQTQWVKRKITDRGKGYEVWNYECPKGLATFIELLR